MAETLNKRILPALAAEARENARRYWEQKAKAAAPAVDPREDGPSRESIFRSHNCWKCGDGAKPCVRGAPNRCEFPHARND